MARESIVNTPHRGSYVLGDYELRVTRRCLAEDLHVDPQSPFQDIMNHEIVKALVKDRATVPAGGKTVGLEAGDMTLYRLGYGHDHRGVTWWDEVHRVVWLCAYHPAHRSGSEEDAFPFFDSLISDSRIMPTADDYERLFEERDEEFDDFVLSDAQEALSKARQTPGIEIQRLIGGRVGTGVVVEVVETLEEIFVAFKWEDVHEDELILIKLLAAFVPDSTWDQWRQARLPTRDLMSRPAKHVSRTSKSDLAAIEILRGLDSRRLHFQGQETRRTQTDTGASTHKPITRTDPSEPEEATVIPATLSKPKHAASEYGQALGDAPWEKRIDTSRDLGDGIDPDLLPPEHFLE